MARRRTMEDSEDAWNSAYDENDAGGSVDNVFSGRESIFDDSRVDTSNPVLQHNEENVLENPVEGPVQWKMVDGFPVPVSSQAGSTEKTVQGQAHLRKTLVAMETPTGVLVSKAVRNTRTGKVQHTEPFRLPTQAELSEVQAKGVAVPPPPGLGSVDPTSLAPAQGIPWGKVAIGGGLAVAAYLAWKKWGQ